MTPDDKRLHRRAHIKKERRERQAHLRHMKRLRDEREKRIGPQPRKRIVFTEIPKPVQAPRGFATRVMEKLRKFMGRKSA